jgi:hypothetical protein
LYRFIDRPEGGHHDDRHIGIGTLGSTKDVQTRTVWHAQVG